jgi:hypothetical protein
MLHRGNFRKQFRPATRIVGSGEAIPLTITRGKDVRVVGYACGECGVVHSKINPHWGGSRAVFLKAWEERARLAAERAAQECHGKVTCKQCGQPVKDHQSSQPCRDCLGRKWSVQAVNSLKRRKTITLKDYTEDWIHADDYGSNDGYFPEIAALEEWCDDEGVSMPCYVEPCKEVRFELGISHILENELSEFHEDAGSEIVNEDELYAFIEAWNKKQSLRSYYPVYDTVIVLDPARFAILLMTGNDPGPAANEAEDAA